MKPSMEMVFLMPMVGQMLVIVFCYFYYSLRKAPTPTSARAKIYRCVVCKYVYVDERKVPLSRCSRCGCLNEAIKR